MERTINTMTEATMKTIGYIACDPTLGDFASDHDGEIYPTYERALKDVDANHPCVRHVGSDGYLYVDAPENSNDHICESEITPTGYGAFCRICGKTLE
jgi:hypothetical protein